ncbi:unnamed protein product, partial [Mesorhabditis spiculigera]
MLLFLSCTVFSTALADNTWDPYERQVLYQGPFFELKGGFNTGDELEIFIFTKSSLFELRISEKPYTGLGFPTPLLARFVGGEEKQIHLNYRTSTDTDWNGGADQPLARYDWDETCECYAGKISIFKSSNGKFRVGSTFQNRDFDWPSFTQPSIVAVTHHRPRKNPECLMMTRGYHTPRPTPEYLLGKIKQWERRRAFKIDFFPHFPIHDLMHFNDGDDDRGPVTNSTIFICLWNITPLNGESFWIVNNKYPFDQRLDRELSIAFEFDLKKQTATMGFRHKGLNYALNTKRFPPSKNGKYGTCFQFGMRRFGVGEIIWMADGIFGKEAISQGRVRLKAAWLSVC